MRVRWLAVALRNLDDEASYIAQDDPATAQRIVMRVFEAVARLRDQPMLGRPGRIDGTRELLVSRTRYVVPYRVRDETIEVLRVFHTSRRMPARW
ncbi:MAG: type II toxin-antitoxin system RelE/ParE family toxin [Burkholderiaceae bacterium]